MIQVQELKFQYPHSEPILDIPSFDVTHGEKIFLWGPSGSGKSTFLSLLTGILAPTHGKIFISGQELSLLNNAQKDQFRGAQIGYIFQSFNLIPYLNVEENIVLPCRLNPTRRERLGTKNLSEAASHLAHSLGIGDKLKNPVLNLSIGQQQRVACARALMGSPPLIIADEPTSSLDSDYRKKFLNLLFAEIEKSKSTLIFVSHDQSLKPLFSRSLSLQEINQIPWRPEE